MLSSKPLPSLLWTVLHHLELAYEREGSREEIPSLDLWANLLRAVDRLGARIVELPIALRLSKRAVRTRVSAAVRNGWIESSGSGVQGTVRLRAERAKIASMWQEIEAAVQKAWSEQVGVDRAVRLREALQNLVSLLPLELPHYPARYGPADASITGGNGKDWKAVPRTDKASVSQLPLSALISQALVAYAMDYEQRSPVALSASTAVIRRIPADGMVQQELGHSTDVSALIRHGFLRVSHDEGKDMVHLTARGEDVSAKYGQRLRDVESQWNRQFGVESIRSLRSALEDIVPVTKSRDQNE